MEPAMSLQLESSSNPEECASRIFAHEADLLAGPQNELRTAIAGINGLIEMLGSRTQSAQEELQQQNLVRINRLISIRQHLVEKAGD
jgi:hypothetical protein